MARAIKASIVNPDRTTSVYYIKKSMMIGHHAFRIKGDEVYIVDPKYSVVTTTKRLGLPFRYTTYYYKRNIPAPVDWPSITGGKKVTLVNTVKDEKGRLVGTESVPISTNDDSQVLIGELPIKVPEFDNAPYFSIPSKELGQLLNPEFLRMITRAAKDKKQELLFMISVGNAIGTAFLIYYMMQQLPASIAKSIGGG